MGLLVKGYPEGITLDCAGIFLCFRNFTVDMLEWRREEGCLPWGKLLPFCLSPVLCPLVRFWPVVQPFLHAAQG